MVFGSKWKANSIATSFSSWTDEQKYWGFSPGSMKGKHFFVFNSVFFSVE